MPTTELIRRPDDLTTAWLEAVLGSPVRGFETEPIGTGQMSESYRVTLDWDAEPATVVLKVAASDPNSRATGVGLGAYEREIRFYQEIAERIGGPVARCHLALYDREEGWFTLVLEDVAPARQGDQIGGCTVDEARVAMEGLARVHAPVLGDVELGAREWLNQSSPLTQSLVGQLLPGFFERYDARIAPEHHALVERFAQSIDGWGADRRAPLGLVHGDFRLDNLLFGEPDSPKPFTVVDWQTVGWGPAMVDASYFLGGGLSVEDRRAHEEELVRAYYDGLVALGATGLSWEVCWEEYRRQCFLGILMAVAASMLVERTPRGDDMFMTLLARHAQQAIDLDAVALLPEPGAGRPPALRPPAEDEGRHAPSAEQLWNESWYLDAVSADGTIGAYVRIGLYPALGVSWYTAYIVGPDRPSIAVVDYAAPLPGPDAELAVATDAFTADHVCESPLERFRVTLAGAGESHTDPAGVLRGESGDAVDVALDLVWETAGEPYAYRMTTRYEIPCTVSGTIRIGDEELTFSGPGQRDHSWGARDWWSMDWVWSALHLDDGARLHAVELRIPDMPLMSVGYAQADGELTELDSVRASEVVGDDGLITSATIAMDPGGIEARIEPLAFGPLLLVAPDGRVSHFPRAMVRATTADGRSGLGWVEWNRNQPRP